jgi:hypothetical protein
MSEFFTDADIEFISKSAYISIDKANRLLRERATVVYGGKDCLGGEWSFVSHNSGESTHTALLIQITPIKQDSAESLLRELCELAKDKREVFTFEPLEIKVKDLQTLIERAKKLLEPK